MGDDGEGVDGEGEGLVEEEGKEVRGGGVGEGVGGVWVVR